MNDKLYRLEREAREIQETINMLLSDLRDIQEQVTELAGPCVQVRFPGDRHGRRYCYRDPSGLLKPGDLVKVPVSTSANLKTAEVVGLGKGTYAGTPHAMVHSKYVAEKL